MPPLLTQAMTYHQTGDLAAAERLYLQIIAAEPGNFSARQLLGVIRAQQGRNAEALEHIAAALTLEPHAAIAHLNYGNVLSALGRLEDALASYDQALALKPDYVAVLNNRGLALRRLTRFAEALASHDRALALEPGNADVLDHRGALFHVWRRFEEAVENFDRALAIQPDFAGALNNRALSLRALRRLDEALASCDKALAIAPGFAEALNNRGITLFDLKRSQEALASYDRALAARPDYAEALNNRAVALWDLARFEEALGNADRALAIRPDFAEALDNRGNILRDVGRHDEAMAAYEKALALEPGDGAALSGLAYCALSVCDWARTTRLSDLLEIQIKAGDAVIQPFVLLGLSNDAALQQRCAENYVRHRLPPGAPALWDGTPYSHERIRIAYLSADFRHHPMPFLMAELFERHDQKRFEVTAISFGPDDGSAMRSRLVKAFDHFHDVRAQNNHAVARMLRDLEIDIAVDLMGYTMDARPEILRARPAPVQVSYLGYPATMGADFIDYVIADETVLPQSAQAFFNEKIVRLPDCYYPSDSGYAIADATPTRAEAGLPQKGFVFCCFNNNGKITAPIFEIWMRLLAAVPGSVLWLLDTGGAAHLRAYAAAKGIDPGRLVFADKQPIAQHLARHRLADLFLDTLPYNAHTTASDALWAGLPLITAMGNCFAGRVAASLLQAIGLPELIATDLSAYEALAFGLATDPAALVAIRQKLAHNRLTTPLFDTHRFRRGMEAAYTTMWRNASRGEPPHSFSA